MTRPAFAALFALAALAACGGPEPRVAVPLLAVEDRVSIRYASVEVRDVSLPTYAAAEGIAVAEGPIIATSDDILWDDDPTRAVTLALARHLTEITGARVAPEPWPFDERPQARVDVRVERLLATEDGLYTLAGQYFVAPLDARGPDRAQIFSLAAPVLGEGAPALAATRAALLADLARLIAREGLR